MNRLPQDYEPKSSDGYFKFKDGDNKIRILSAPIMWFEYFTTENKPVRSRDGWDEKPDDIKQGGKVKEFRAFVIYNYDAKRVQIMSINQNTIKSQLFNLSRDPDFGNPTEYDLKINKSGESLETKYIVKALSKTPLPKEVAEAQFNTKTNLEALFEWKEAI